MSMLARSTKLVLMQLTIEGATRARTCQGVSCNSKGAALASSGAPGPSVASLKQAVPHNLPPVNGARGPTMATVYQTIHWSMPRGGS